MPHCVRHISICVILGGLPTSGLSDASSVRRRPTRTVESAANGNAYLRRRSSRNVSLTLPQDDSIVGTG